MDRIFFSPCALSRRGTGCFHRMRSVWDAAFRGGMLLAILVSAAVFAYPVQAQDRPTPRMISRAKAGDIEAGMRLGDMYMEGIGTDVDLVKAMDAYACAAEPNYWPAIEMAASCYRMWKSRENKSVAPGEIEEYFAGRGYAWGMNGLASWIEEQDSLTPATMARAFDLHEKSAAKGNLLSCKRLGEAYSQGEPLAGGSQDLAKAVQYYEKAANIKMEADSRAPGIQLDACRALMDIYGSGPLQNEKKFKKYKKLATRYEKQLQVLGNEEL